MPALKLRRLPLSFTTGDPLIVVLSHSDGARLSAEVITLQAEYADWAEALPGILRDTPTAEALQAIVDLDLTQLADIEPPRGYGRD